MALVSEKVVQHVVVSLAFFFDWGGIGASVRVNPQLLLVLGSIAAVLFAFALWGLTDRRPWASRLVVGLAVFDIVGEFVAQGTPAITMTVSFLVATLLLALSLGQVSPRLRLGA